MRRTIFLGLAAVVAILLVVLLWSIYQPSRMRLIRQNRTLVDSITMQIDDLQLHGDNGQDALYVRCRYLNGDPNVHYHLTGSLLASPTGPGLDYGIYGQAAAAPVGEPGVPVFWTFSKAPEHLARFTMRITLTSNDDPPSQRRERHVDFTLPYLPVRDSGGDHYQQRAMEAGVLPKAAKGT